MRPTVVVSRAGGGDPRAGKIEEPLAGLCAAAGFEVVLTPHIYHVPEESGLWEQLAKVGTDTVLDGQNGICPHFRRAFFTWLHPRPAEALLRRHGVWRDGDHAFCLGSRDTPEALFRDLRQAVSWSDAGSGKPGAPAILESLAGERWYPVVDQVRCTHCRSCFQFCLFGVYALDGDQKVRVANPGQCKAGCPACSRICPSGAIMFPLYEQDAAIAGAPGRFMTPDAAARRMFYLRTGRPCPVCGQAGRKDARHKGALCAECNRRTGSPAVPAPADELDRLIDGLEKLQQRNRGT
jgi:hypothetical protein